jgi:hypothetical protein
VVRNRGGAPVEIGELQFELGGRVLGPRQRRLSPVETPVYRPPWREMLAPGAERFLRADVADYAGESLAPGRYACRAIVGGAGAAFAFEVTPMPVARLARVGPGESRAAAWAAGDAVMVRTMICDPDSGVAVRQWSGPVESLAVIHGMQAWFAVLANGRLSAGRAGPIQLLAWLDGPQIGAARLISVEESLDRFVIAGARDTRVVTLAIDGDGIVRQPRELALGPAIDVALPPSAAAIQIGDDVIAVWSDGARLYARTMAPGADTRTLLDRPVRAFAVSRDAVNAVCDGAAVRVGHDGAIVRESPLPPPPDGVRAWAISPANATPLAVAVLAGRAAHLAADDGWRTVAEVGEAASELAVLEGHWPRVWIEWVDPSQGLLHAPAV